MLARSVHQRVFVNPSHAGGVRTQSGGDSGRQAFGNEVQLLQHPAARPIQIRAVFENDVDEGKPEKGISANHFGERNGQQGGGQRIGDLVLDDLRGLAGKLGEDNHLDVAQIRNRVQWRAQHGINTPRDNEQGAQNNQKSVF